MADLLKKITDLPSGTPTDVAVIPYVEGGITKKALKSELKGDKGDTGTAATVDAGTTTTLAAGESATVTNIGTTSAAIFNFAIPQGIQGVAGATGAKVTSVAFSGNDIVFTLDDSSTVTLTNAKIDLKGDKGDQGIQGIQGVQGDKGDKGDTGNTGLTGDKGDKGDTGAKITSAGFSGNDLVFNLDDSSSVTISNAKTDLKGDKGDKGDTGAKGDQGIQGIQGITGNTGAKGDTGAKITSASFVSDDLVFTLDDSSTVTITGAKTTLKGDKGDKGEKGDQGIQGLTGDKGDKGDKGDTGLTGAKGDKGEKGDTGPAGSGTGDMLASTYDADGGAKQVAFKDQLHNAVTVTDTAEIDMTLTGQDIKADIKTASIDKSKLDSGVQSSLGKADSAIQDISGKQDALGYTAENSANKVTSISGASTDVQYPSAKLVYDQLATKGSGTVTAVSIATANGISGTSSGGATPALTLSLGDITPTTVNGVPLGKGVNSLISNIALGLGSLSKSNSGNGQNTALGYYSNQENLNGAFNTSIGTYSLWNNKAGIYNTAIGVNSLLSNGGSRKIGLGAYAGAYETGSDAFYVDSRNRTNTAGDKAGAILYGVMSDTPSSQTLKTNSAFEATYGMNIPTGQTYKINGTALAASDIGAQPVGTYLTSANIEDSITDGHTTIAPSGNAVFDALAGKASLTGTETLTNKRINPRLVTAASYTTDTGTSLDVSTCDQFEITAQAGALKLNNPGGTPLGGQKLIIRIKDNGTARALTYDTQFRAMGNALPSTTVVNKTLYMGFIYNATDTKWDLVAVANEA